jgi:branched-chain amino acid transport system ATP-binding protein
MTEAVLEVCRLRKSFGALKATDDVSLSLEPGEIHAIIGPNGAGKTTLIGQIAGAVAADAGRIVLNGTDVTGFSTARRARMGLGRTFQVSQLAMSLSVRRNVLMAAQARTGTSYRFWKQVRHDPGLNAAADIALSRVELLARADVMVGELSHGERRQLELACALALRPCVLLLDEPMAGLGHYGSVRMVDFLEQLKTEVPIVLVEHDMDAVFRLADRISVLVYGRVIASGDPRQIRGDARVREAYLGEEG